MPVEATPGVKMLYLIRRRPGVSHDELVMHWFAYHMPAVIRAQQEAAAAGRPHARRYLVTLFDAAAEGELPWDGVAQLWWDAPPPRPPQPHGTTPRDTFQQRAEPYLPWATTEYVVLAGTEFLATAPLTLNAPPYPSTRSGFVRFTFLVKAKAGTNYAAFFDHWLHVHVPNVKATLEQAGGFRYAVSLSLTPEAEPYAGMAELYFPDVAAWERYCALRRPRRHGALGRSAGHGGAARQHRHDRHSVTSGPPQALPRERRWLPAARGVQGAEAPAAGRAASAAPTSAASSACAAAVGCRMSQKR
ncbi:MAG: hypothetical protein KatS3mg131_1496 [Candidatus Tectimicrobiota bacterium]|nr:MAG: hypothetical protein KatS3mg131_1496 [Candidatus Tectomicrobia bacterium]